MKKMIPVILLVIASGFIVTDFYSITFKKINGRSTSLDSFRNKKILVTVLPVASDSNFLMQLDSLSNEYAPGLVVIGVPPYEYSAGRSNTSLREFYQRFMDSSVIVTEKMPVLKSSPLQHALFRWLTDKSQNSHFDFDEVKPGTRFLINANGELFGVFAPDAKLDNTIFRSLLL